MHAKSADHRLTRFDPAGQYRSSVAFVYPIHERNSEERGAQKVNDTKHSVHISTRSTKHDSIYTYTII